MTTTNRIRYQLSRELLKAVRSVGLFARCARRNVGGRRAKIGIVLALDRVREVAGLLNAIS